MTGAGSGATAVGCVPGKFTIGCGGGAPFASGTGCAEAVVVGSRGLGPVQRVLLGA